MIDLSMKLTYYKYDMTEEVLASQEIKLGIFFVG